MTIQYPLGDCNTIGLNITTATHRESGRSRSLTQPIRLLFIGVDWKIKGGETAYMAMKELNSR
ncbi:MAG TPA: hypothetical protein ENN47_05825 [Mesotoga infera]|uniref:Uncharacterized protein n=1 Tax=Mesotoga infera TaxID=1236046 RepID=A0A7C1CWF5_9BACT|nr:hypothetical protein [Mesotoga infera]